MFLRLQLLKIMKRRSILKKKVIISIFMCVCIIVLSMWSRSNVVKLVKQESLLTQAPETSESMLSSNYTRDILTEVYLKFDDEILTNITVKQEVSLPDDEIFQRWKRMHLSLADFISKETDGIIYETKIRETKREGEILQKIDVFVSDPEYITIALSYARILSMDYDYLTNDGNNLFIEDKLDGTSLIEYLKSTGFEIK